MAVLWRREHDLGGTGSETHRLSQGLKCSPSHSPQTLGQLSPRQGILLIRQGSP